MAMAGMWKKHRFLSLDKEDEIDKVIAGEQFIVRYIGSTRFSEYEKREKPLMEFYCNLLTRIPSKLCNILRLIVDLSGAILYDKEGNVSQHFELSNISDAIYCNKIQEYSCYFVLVGQEKSERFVKAHVFVCEDKKKAKDLYEAFMQAFTLGAEIKSLRRQASVSEPYMTSPGKSSHQNNKNNNRMSPHTETSEPSSKEYAAGFDNINNMTTASRNSIDDDESNCRTDSEVDNTDSDGLNSAQQNNGDLTDLEESFTKLARSRLMQSSSETVFNS